MQSNLISHAKKLEKTTGDQKAATPTNQNQPTNKPTSKKKKKTI
jgi:hypothetical protein